MSYSETPNSVERLVDDLAKEVGRARSDIHSDLTAFQSLLSGMGFGADEAAECSKKLLRSSIDLAAVSNICDADAVSRLRSAMCRKV